MLDDIKKTSLLFIDEYSNLVDPYTLGGIKDISICSRDGILGIIVHITSSKEAFDLIPSQYNNYPVYKVLE